MVRWKSQQGFLMVEVLIAIVIISIALVAAAGMFIQSTKNNTAADEYTVAVSLAQKQMELLKSKMTTNDWANLASTSLSWQGEESHPVVLNNKTYTIATVAENCPEDSVNLVQVRVTVSWLDKSMVLTTFFSKL